MRTHLRIYEYHILSNSYFIESFNPIFIFQKVSSKTNDKKKHGKALKTVRAMY